jgi:hypothetical protein
MSKITIQQPVDTHFLAVMSHLKTLIRGLDALNVLENIVDQAQSAAHDIEQALLRSETPSKEDIEAALRVLEAVDTVKQEATESLDAAWQAAKMLLGHYVRETNGDSVEPERASEYAQSEALV